jgi:phosphatidylglycerol:prolipoprotein diacylglycerol transferase
MRRLHWRLLPRAPAARYVFLFEYPDINPVAFALGPLRVHWYGLMYVAGFVAGWSGLRAQAARADAPVSRARVEDLLFYVAVGVFAGGRIGYMLIYDFAGLLADPLSLLFVWRGGMSFHGGLVGVLIAMAVFARRNERTFFEISDFVAPWVPPAICFVRIGNFINGELWGRETGPDAPWAVIVDGVARHPTTLYEAFLEGLVLFVVLLLFAAKARPRMAVSGLFLLLYGAFRFAVEFIRLPDAHIGYLAFDWVTLGMVLTVPMIVIGGVLVAVAYRRGTPTR